MASTDKPKRRRKAPDIPINILPPKEPVRPPLLELSDRHWLFIHRYMVHRNARRAFREAFPENSSAREGSNLLSDPMIRAEINERTAALFAKYEVTAERIVAEAAKIAFSNALDVFDDDGRLRSPQEIQLEVGAAIKSWQEGKDGTKFTMHDKLAALIKLGLDEGLFRERVEHGGTVVNKLIIQNGPTRKPRDA